MSQTDEGVEELPEDESEYDESEEEEEVEEDEWSIYDSDTFISGPLLSDECSIPDDILEFHFSFGYDCRRYFNLTVADPDTLVFASGNLINFFNVETKTVSFRRSALGGGIGHIKSNPNPEYNHIAVAENGDKPLIIVYEWPSMEIDCVLKEGSSKLYSYLDYNPDGSLLVSQGGEPDYLITVWNWPKRRILLRTKSYVNDIYRVKFSPYVPGQLTSCGISHIKFWKMAATFTGLKLKGELGRFGKTEFSDILGVLPMPDEKVVSGCAWGNILVWDAGLIKLEVFRTFRRKCHDAPIVQFHFYEGELWTVSMDGHVKIWWYEKIDQADPPDDDRVVQLEPTYDFFTPGVMLMCLRKRYVDPTDTFYFGQDGNGGIWYIDLNTDDTPKPSVQLYKCHAGRVVDLAACPWGPFLASLGQGGKFHLYDYLNKRLIFYHHFPAPGACLIWFPVEVAKSGDEFVLGFDDGTLRLCVLTIPQNLENINLKVTQTIKPHAKSVTKISINSNGTILVSGGEDCTIFIFQVKYQNCVTLVPIGFISVPNVVTCLTWHHENVNEILVGCLRGEIVQVMVPGEPQDYTKVSYALKLEPKHNKFTTYKAQIRRDLKIKEIEERKAAKLEKKREEMEKVKKENPGLDIDEEVFLADSESEEELEPLHIPEVPNRVIWMQSTPEDTIWLSMGGYDAGYIYEYKIDQKDPVPYRFKMVHDADDVEISSYIYNYNKKYLIFAMQNGEIRVNKIKDGDFRDLSDYWSLAMHDNLNGFVPKMSFSFDEKYFFTCGHDGNVFSYQFNPEDDDYVPSTTIPNVAERWAFPSAVPDEANYDKLSLEQTSLKIENDRIERVANANKEKLREKLKVLSGRFYELLKRNNKLLKSQIIPAKDLELDHRITAYIDEKLEAQLELVKRKLAFEVEKSEVGMIKLRKFLIDPLDFFPITVKGINSNVQVRMLRQRKIAREHEEMLRLVEQKLLDAELKGRPPERAPPPPKIVAPKKQKERPLEYFLISLSPSVIETRLGPKITRFLYKYRLRKLKWEERQEEWDEFLARKPVKGVNHPEDEASLAEAKLTIGDYKLKSAKDYKVPKELRESTLKKYKQLLLTRIKQFEVRYKFNKAVFDLRAEKVNIRQQLTHLQNELSKIHEEIPETLRKEGSTFEPEDESEFPERNMEINVPLPGGTDQEEAEEEVQILLEPEAGLAEQEMLPENITMSEGDFELTDPSDLDFSKLLKLSEVEEKDSIWEQEIRVKRLERKLFEQDEIVQEMVTKLKDFNKSVKDLSRENFVTEVNGRSMDLFILTLHQELVILKDFEALEDSLQEKVNQRTTEVLDMVDSITELTDDISGHNKEIDKLNERGKNIQDTFFQSVHDNKFYDFLKKVFRKKYKPPKVHKDDESSSESSSSSSSSSDDDDDGGSVDSRDFGIIKQDLNVCPKGCDPAIYEYTVSLRSQRHQVELQVKEEYKVIEMLKKDLEILNKKVRVIEKTLADSLDDLEKFQREKQRKLNEVRCTVVMRLNQFQHLTPDNNTSLIMDTLVFSKTLLSKLYKRVDQLQIETDQQKAKHQVNVRHLARMKTDCKYMTRKIKDLKNEIIGLMKIKFGKVVDINEIEEAMLKRTFGKDDLNDLEEVLLKKLVHDLRMSLMDIKGMYVDELKLWRNNVVIAQKELAEILRDNSCRHQLLTLMNKEKVELARTIENQEKKKEHLNSVEDTAKHYKEEIEKLEAVVNNQNKQLQELKDEIKVLKTKGMPPKPPAKIKEKVEPEEAQLWEKFEEFVGLEEMEEVEETKPFATEILIPIVLPEDSQQIVSGLIEEMFEALNIKITKRSTENFIKQTVSTLMHRVSVAEIVNDLIKNLPIEPDGDQRGIIETTAEQLCAIQEPEVTEEDINACAIDIIEEIIDEVLLTKEGPNEMVAAFVNKLVEQLPLEFIIKKESIEVIVGKLLDSALNAELDRRELMEMVNRQEARIILDKILEKVFATGIDYLYIIQ